MLSTFLKVFFLFRTAVNVLYLLFTGKPETVILDLVLVIFLGGCKSNHNLNVYDNDETRGLSK